MGPKRRGLGGRYLLLAAAFALVACTGDGTKPVATSPLGDVPVLNVTDPFNDQGNCLAADVVAAPGGFKGPSLESGHCTSQDIKIASADVLEYSFDGVTFITFVPGTPVSCQENTPIFVRLVAHVKETATSERTDIGVWVATDGGNGRTGVCNHYNLAPAPAFEDPPIENANHVWNIDNDQCGDMNNAGEALVPLGEISTVCQATGTSSLLHIGSCLGWTQPGGDQVCPTAASPTGFRYGTVPGTSSKCNCDGFDVPIEVRKTAKLEVVKACTPASDPGTFDLLIDGLTSSGTPPVDFGNNKACGGTTGIQVVGAGTNLSPGAVHSHGEGDFNTALYTSSFSCVNRVGGASRGSGTSLGPNNITLQPNDDVICTYTNVRQPEVKLVKVLDPTTDGGRFDFTLAGTSFNNGGAGYGHNGTTGFQIVAIGPVSFSESGNGSTSLADYVTTKECRNAADQVVTSGAGTTSGSVTVAAGDKITCTFTNQRKPKLKVVKATVPTSDPGTFDFTINGVVHTNSGVGYGNGQGTDFVTLSVGSVNISEAAHAGTDFTTYTKSLACTYAGGASVTVSPNGGSSGTVPLAAGDVITCTFTNTKGATLKLVKLLNPTNDAGKFNFAIGATSFTNGGVGYGHNGTTGFQGVAFGAVSFSESGNGSTSLGDYVTTHECRNASDVVVPSGGGTTSGSVTVGAGDQITCTFTNNRKPQVKVVKALNPTSDPGKFNLTLAGTTYDNGGAGFGNGGNTGFQNVAVGPVAFSEAGNGSTALTDYVSSQECRNGSNAVVPSGAGTTSGSVTVAYGDVITCTITNNRKPEVKLVKVLNPTTDPGKFNLTLAGTTYDNAGAGFGHNGTTGFVQVAVGAVSFSEAGNGSTALTDYVTTKECLNASLQVVASGAGTTSGSVTVAYGDKITCTFTNSRKPQLKIIKVLDPTSDPGKFDFIIEGITHNNSGAGYGHNQTTGFVNVSTGSVAFSEVGHTGTVLSEFTTTLECRNASNQVVGSNPGTGNKSGSVTVAYGDQITCTFTNKHAPNLTLTKTPNAGTASPGGTAEFTITVANGAGGGPALGVEILDTLPADVGDWVENPNKTECTIVPLLGGTDDRVLACNVGTLAPGTSFTVIVQATIPTNFTVKPPAPAGDPLEVEGDLIDSPAGGALDWATAGINCTSVPKVGCAIDLPTGSGDNSFGQGTKEDTPVPSVVDGSIPNNKSDLLRFYVATQRITTFDHLYLAWERVQEPTGTTNMDFEFNQSTTLSANGTTPVRTAGDALVKYDLAQGGVNPILGFHRWVTSGACEANGAKPPCWGPVIALNTDVAGAINTGVVVDPIDPDAPRNLSVRTFGEARINLQASGIFQPGVCVSFGSAYLKSRSSDAFTAAIKDFIAPIPINLTNCEPKPLLNTAFARATNFAPVGGQPGDWISDNGAILVSDASNAGFLLNIPTRHVGLSKTTTTSVVFHGFLGEAILAGEGRSVARQRSSTPRLPQVTSDRRPVAGTRIQPEAAMPHLRLLS